MSELSAIRIWWLAIRPKTLWAAVAPVVVGAAMAGAAGPLHLPSLGVTLMVAVLIQIGTNLANDYADFQKGTDTAERIGPMRVTQAGLVTPRQVLFAAALSFGLTLVGCGYLVYCAGWPLAVIGVLSVAAGILYTSGPYPLGYIGLADLFVLVFFGPVAVGGTYFIQTGALPAMVIVAGIAPGLLSTAILVVNNLRDIDGDRAAGKRSLAVRFGPGFARGEYLACMLGGALVPVALVILTRGHAGSLAATAAVLALAPKRVRTMFTSTDGPTLNATLAATAKILLIYAILFAVGWGIGSKE